MRHEKPWASNFSNAFNSNVSVLLNIEQSASNKPGTNSLQGIQSPLQLGVRR